MTEGAGAALPLALTMGDPAGIGGEITLKAWRKRSSLPRPFFVIDDPERLTELSERLGWKVPLSPICAPRDTAEAFTDSLPVIPLTLSEPSVAGSLNPAHAAAVRDSIEQAVAFVQQGQAAAVITNPIHKQALYQSGFDFPGHTEFLAHLAGIETPPVMMLASDVLRVVPVTIHVGLTEAVRQLTAEKIIEAAAITHQALHRDFGIEAPRLAVAGLNPHAGEGGAMGSEEATIIAPAIAALRDQGITVTGPVPPDTLFTEAARRTYDAAICMYHDQALIPIKTLDFEGAVNVTLGLPFIRTSPDHGTGLDIAGRGTASETSLLAALRLAAAMADARQQVR
ncbi:MAG: 4-hydroxythreonine-4-phosphate dehydrogenase PdxA [Rhodospirillales bacterium]|nr:4-hydroxythreonine-4-phosphate dehydrogenase PdxA [Rhodospirillales bacterium]